MERTGRDEGSDSETTLLN